MKYNTSYIYEKDDSHGFHSEIVYKIDVRIVYCIGDRRSLYTILVSTLNFVAPA